MSMRSVRGLTVGAILAACSVAMGVDQVNGPAGDLLGMYPGSRVHVDEGGRVKMFYGAPMTPGLDARDAAGQWIKAHGRAFGCGALELSEQWTTSVRDGRFTVLSFGQTISGLPVEYGDLRVLVLNGPVPRVVYTGGNLAAVPENLNAPRIDSNIAIAMAKAHEHAKVVTSWGKPALVVYQGDGDWVAPSVAWKIEALGADPREARTFFVSASNGQVLRVRGDVVYEDVQGTVKAMRTPGVYPDAPYNPPQLMDMPEVRVSISGGNNAYTDAAGVFTILNPGTTAVTLNTGVNSSSGGGGHWSNVNANGVAELTATANGNPPGPFNLVLNAAPSAQMTAQVNALACANITHSHFTDRAPGFSALDIAISTNTGVSGSCNAFFSPADLSINFYNQVGSCVNSAYSSVVSHEYGHFIVNRLGRAQNSFGEGFGDTMAILIWDDGVVGRGWQGQTTAIRNPAGANIQYPCSSGQCGTLGVHCCGQQLGALVTRVRVNLGTLLGSQPGLEEARDQHIAWALITAGGPTSTNAIGPTTAIEWLTIDDTDGNLTNGTPHYAQICSAFSAGGVQCPELLPIVFSYPNGRPDALTPGQPTEILVSVTGQAATPAPGTGTLSYRIGAGGYTTVPMTQSSPNQYTVMIPAADCAESVEYYFSVQSTTSTTHTDPSDAPGSAFSAAATQGVSTTVVADLDFQTDPGWSVQNTSVSTGAWGRGVPHVPASNGCPSSDADGSGVCWLTDNRAGDNPNFDVDGGPTILNTGAYDLSGYALVDVSYSRWLTSINGSVDSMLFQYSTNNGTNWTTLDTATGNSGSWVDRTFSIANPTAETRFRWIISDSPSDSVTEAGIDAFLIEGYVCGQACYANCDGSTSEPVLNVADFSCFLQRFGAGDSYANCDGSTGEPVLNVADFSCFLQSFAAGCR